MKVFRRTDVVRNVAKTRTNREKMKNLIYLLLITFTIISCNHSKSGNAKRTKKNVKEVTKMSIDSVSVPTFKIQLNLSEKAEKMLKDKNESIIIAVDFIGEPEKRIIETRKYEFYNENGDMNIGSKRIEFESKRTIKFENCKVSKKLLKLLKNKTYDVRINVVSGRKSSKDNLITCDYYQESIIMTKNKKIILNGKLIYGE